MTHQDKPSAFSVWLLVRVCRLPGGARTEPAASSQKHRRSCPLWSLGLVRPRGGGALSLLPCLCCGSVAPHLPLRFRVRLHGRSQRHPGISMASQRA